MSGTEELRAMAQDVTSGVCGAPRTMRDLLGVATLVLAAGMPWVLPAAAGEKRGSRRRLRGGARGWAVSTWEVTALEGGWRNADVCLGDLWSSWPQRSD